MRIKKNKVWKDFIDMEQMELAYYSEDHVTPYEEAYQWYLANPGLDMAVEDSGKIVAFSDIIPLKPAVYERVLERSFNDKYLTAEDMLQMEALKKGDVVNLLLSCIVVQEEYRKTEALKLLLNHHLDYYREFIRNGISVDWVLTSNVTEAGERFSERMGFERLGRTSHGSTLFRIRFSELDQRVMSMKSRLEVLLLRNERNLLDREFCRDRCRIEQLLADDFTEYGQSGTVYHKKDTIDVLYNGRISNIEIRGFEVKTLGTHTAMVHYIAHEQAAGFEQSIGAASLRTSIWRFEEDAWKLLFHQATQLKNRG